MGERFRQEQRIAELIADAFFQRIHVQTLYVV
jgi:hypothetical protein